MECRLERYTFHYELFGEGRPIVFLHGWLANRESAAWFFEPLFQQRDGWKRIYPDLPGRGSSPGPDWLSNQDQILDLLLEFIQTLIPEQNYCVAGFSYGAYLAQGLIYHRPQLVDGALFVAPVTLVNVEEMNRPEHVTLVEDETLLSDMTEEESNLLRSSAVVQSRHFLDYIREYGIPSIEKADHSFLETLANQMSFSVDVSDLPQPFDRPVLFLLGRQDSMVGYRDAWNLIENYPRASYAVLDMAGHFVSIERKELFNALIAEWLDRVELNSSLVA